MKRNLLSSQPLCFNLFGYLRAHPAALLPWVQAIEPRAESITRVELEWAPLPKARGGSAFDAFVEFAQGDGTNGFLGIECKYAEKLTESQRADAAEKYRKDTKPPAWTEGAVEVLDQHGLRQLWYNQLHVQDVTSELDYATGIGVVVACAADHEAQEAVEQVREVLTDPDELRFSSLGGSRELSGGPRRLEACVLDAVPRLQSDSRSAAGRRSAATYLLKRGGAVGSGRRELLLQDGELTLDVSQLRTALFPPERSQQPGARRPVLASNQIFSHVRLRLGQASRADEVPGVVDELHEPSDRVGARTIDQLLVWLALDLGDGLHRERRRSPERRLSAGWSPV